MAVPTQQINVRRIPRTNVTIEYQSCIGLHSLFVQQYGHGFEHCPARVTENNMQNMTIETDILFLYFYIIF